MALNRGIDSVCSKHSLLSFFKIQIILKEVLKVQFFKSEAVTLLLHWMYRLWATFTWVTSVVVVFMAFARSPRVLATIRGKVIDGIDSNCCKEVNPLERRREPEGCDLEFH